MPYWVIVICIVSAIFAFLMTPDERLQPAVNFLSRSAAVKFLAFTGGVIGFIVVLATAFQISIDIVDRRDERAHRREDAISRAWQRLLAPNPGNTGKGSAFNYLLQNGEAIGRVDLSCRSIGRWSAKAEACEMPAILDGVVLSPEIADGRDSEVLFLTNVLLEGTILVSAEINRTHFEQAGLRGVVISQSRVLNAVVNGDMSDATIEESDLTGSALVGRLDGLAMRNVNVSNLAIRNIAAFDRDRMRYLYAWADAPLREMPAQMPDRFQPEQATLLDTSTLKPTTDHVLSRVSLCEPSNEISAVPLADRPALSWTSCRRTSLIAARARFPKIYSP